MALLAEVGTLASPTSTGQQTVTLDSNIWGGESPKLVIFFYARRLADGIVSHARQGAGVAISAASQASMSVVSTDNVVTSAANRRHTNAACISSIDITGNVAAEAVFVSHGSEQFVVNWTTVDPVDPYLYNFMALGGDSLDSIYLDQIQSPASTGQVAYTGVGFQPDALWAFSTQQSTAPPSTQGDSYFVTGCSDGVTDHTCYASSDDNQGTSNTKRSQITGFLQFRSAGNGGVRDSATVVSLDADGYTLNWTDADATQRYIWVLCIKGPQVNVLTGNQPAANGDASRAIGFAPRAALFTTFMGPTAATAQDDARIGIGAWDYSNNMAFSGAVDEDAQGTTDADCIQDSDEAIKHIDHARNVVGSMTAAASGNNLVETWADCDGTQREHGMIVFGDDEQSSSSSYSSSSSSSSSSTTGSLTSTSISCSCSCSSSTSGSLTSTSVSSVSSCSSSTSGSLTSTSVSSSTTTEMAAYVVALSHLVLEGPSEQLATLHGPSSSSLLIGSRSQPHILIA